MYGIKKKLGRSCLLVNHIVYRQTYNPHFTSPVHPKPFAAKRWHRVHTPVDEHSKLGLVVPRGQRSSVQAGPVRLVSLDVGRCRLSACWGRYPRCSDGNGKDHVGHPAEVRHLFAGLETRYIKIIYNVAFLILLVYILQFGRRRHRADSKIAVG